MDRRLVKCAFALAVAAGVSSCSSTRTVPVSEPDRSTAALAEDRGQEISGYTTTAAVYHDYAGWVRLAGDSLVFTPKTSPRPSAWTTTEPRRADLGFEIPRDSVASVQVVHHSAAGAVATTVVVAGAVVVAFVASESCPFLYSWDGRRFVLDGEPFGGATMSSLERTDWSELDQLRPAQGRYRLLMTNEVDETQHVNSVELLAVDHPPGTAAVMDPDGAPHAFRRVEPLLSAVDESGEDLTPWLHDRDERIWYPDLRAYAGRDSLRDARNHIVLTFARPAGLTRGYLVCDVATGPWGSHMLRSMLAMRGSRVGEFYAAVNGSDAWRRALHAWNEREELYELIPEVDRGGRWSRQPPIPGGGPIVAESRAIPIDWSGLDGDTVRVRIHPPIGFWRLDSFHLAWDEETVRTAELRPVAARGGNGPDILERLAGDDDRYLDMPTTEDQASLEFTAPPVPPGAIRSVFARTRGWYEIHLHAAGAAPDSVSLARLVAEPGAAVRLCLREVAADELARAPRNSRAGGPGSER